jgi:N-acyl-D-amino-acid deacylase
LFGGLALSCLAAQVHRTHAQGDADAAYFPENTGQTETDEYTRYELLAPESNSFKIYYEVTATTAGAKFFYNPIRKGSIASDESVTDAMLGTPLHFAVVNGAEARKDPLMRDADLGVDYIKVTLARPVPVHGQGRLIIVKTYKDPKSYHLDGNGIVFDRPLGVKRNKVVLPLGYEVTGLNVPSQILTEKDGRIAISFLNAGSGEAPLIVHGIKDALVGAAALPQEPTTQPSWEAPFAGETEQERLSERAHQDRDIVYFLQQPESHAFSLYHDYTESRAGISGYANVVREGSVASHPSASILDTGEQLIPKEMSGAELMNSKINTGEAVAAAARVVVIPFAAVQAGQSVRLRIAETYTAPVSYRLDGDELVFDRSLGRPRNAVMLPSGWYCTFSAAPATLSLLPDGRVRLDYWDDRPEPVDVLLKAKRRIPTDARIHDLVLRNGFIVDGSGRRGFAGDVVIDADRIAYVGPDQGFKARTEIDVKGQVIAPGFINMLAHPEESLFADGRALSDLMQGVTLEVMGEFSMGPLNADMSRLMVDRESDIKYPVTWRTLGEYLETLEHHGISPNVASFVGAPTVRTYVLGEGDVQPTANQLDQMRALVHESMEEGALGLTTALIYAPADYAKTPELIAMAQESARCGGIYTAHIRSEGDRIESAVQETIDIAAASGAPAEIYHLKIAGQSNWSKLDAVIAQIEKARASGIRITANMYTYAAGATGLDAAMPPAVQAGGLEAWIGRLKDPAIRAKVVEDMRVLHPPDWENLYAAAGPDGTLLLAFKNPKLKPLTGKTLAQVAKMRGVTPEDAAIDLVIEDGSRVGVAYFLMNEDNIRRQVALPWVSFGSDEAGDAPEGVFLLSAAHPRAYGNFAKVFAQYVRKDHILTLEQAVRKLATLPADNLSLPERGRLLPGTFADVVVFDPNTIQDHATYDKPHQLATGVSAVVVNGILAVKDGAPTGAHSGRIVRGRAWIGASSGGGCRAAAKDWTWSN